MLTLTLEVTHLVNVYKRLSVTVSISHLKLAITEIRIHNTLHKVSAPISCSIIVRSYKTDVSRVETLHDSTELVTISIKEAFCKLLVIHVLHYACSTVSIERNALVVEVVRVVE